MAKHTAKNDALGMFGNIKPVKRDPVPETAKPLPEMEEPPVEAKKIAKEEESVIPMPEKRPASASSKSSKSVPAGKNGIILRIGEKKKKKGRTSHTRSFYMKDEIYEWLLAGAEADKVGVSEYLEFILEQLFID